METIFGTAFEAGIIGSSKTNNNDRTRTRNMTRKLILLPWRFLRLPSRKVTTLFTSCQNKTHQTLLL